jgi:hypothetical protein
VTGAEPDLDLRQVTGLHARWQDNGDDVPGSFVLSVLLDDGARELVAQAPAEVLQAALPLIFNGTSAVVDLARGAVIIGHIEISVTG